MGTETDDTGSDTAEYGPMEYGPISEAELAEFMAEITVEHGPRRFALFGVADDREDAAALAWGLAFDDACMLYLLYGHRSLLHVDGSAETAARRAFGTAHDVRIHWIDPR